MRYDDLPLSTLSIYLAEARSALHGLLTGRAAVAVGTASGQRVQYAQAQAGDLRRYIAELEAAVAAAGGALPANRPIRIAF